MHLLFAAHLPAYTGRFRPTPCEDIKVCCHNLPWSRNNTLECCRQSLDKLSFSVSVPKLWYRVLSPLSFPTYQSHLSQWSWCEGKKGHCFAHVGQIHPLFKEARTRALHPYRKISWRIHSLQPSDPKNPWSHLLVGQSQNNRWSCRYSEELNY